MFNFWPFNVARKRREAEREKRIAQLVEDMDRPQPKRNKVIPMSDPRHPRNLSPQQRQRIKEREAEQQAVIQRDRDAWARYERQSRQRDQPFAGIGLSYDYDADPSRLVAQHSDERRMDPAPAEVVAQVQQFRCDHPAISEFWQQQQERCDSPSADSSPSCDAPSTDN